MSEALIYDAVRTPRTKAKPHGGLHLLSPLELLKQLYQALEQRVQLDPSLLDDLMLGCVTQFSEQGGNIARASVIYSDWPEQLAGISLNRFCSSSLDAACLAADKIRAGSAKAIVCGGVESMSRVPMLADQPQWMLEPQTMIDTRSVPLGLAADLIATQAGYSREDLDRYALESQQRALYAQDHGYFDHSLVPITNTLNADNNQRKTSLDELIRTDVTLTQLAGLKPAFATLLDSPYGPGLLKLFPKLADNQHLHTAGNSPAMADAASLVLIGNRRVEHHLGHPARAKIIAYHTCCGPVGEVLTGGTLASQILLSKLGMSPSDLDLIEFNESFAGPTLKFIEDLGLDHKQVNVNGGAIALGHPMGATGGILIGTLLAELERQDKQLGLVSICGAAGSGTAMLIDREL